jgi:hypothetical protein
MPLFIFTNLNKHGNLRKRLIYRPSSQFSYSPKGLGKFVSTRSFKYTYEHDFLPPGLYTNFEGKKYITPTWQEVHPQTTLEDINWVKPKKIEHEIPKDTWEFKSSSSESVYTVKQTGHNKFQCNCPGYWRSAERKCKHVKEVEKCVSVR